MDTVKRLPLRPAIIFLVLASFVLAACTGQTADSTWPGMSADEQGVVYIAYGPAVIAVDVENNEQLWSFPQGESNTAPIFAAPEVSDGRVVFGDFGVSGGLLSPNKKISVYSLDASDGSLNSNWPVGEVAQDRIIASALLVGDSVFVGTADNLVFALDADTAQPLWSEPFQAEHSIWGKPAHQDGIIFVPSLDKNVYALDAESGEVAWNTNVEGSVSDKVVRDSDAVYVGSFDHNAYALDSQSGEVKWMAPAEASVWGAPLHVDGVVYFADLEGNVFAVNADSGEEIWMTPGAGYVVAQPVFADGKVFIASAGDPEVAPDERDGALIAFDAETGEELWRSVTTRAPLFTTPVVSGDTVVVAQQDEQVLLVYYSFDGAQTGSFPRPAA